MRANLAAYFYSARPRFAKQPHTASCSEVLAMNRMIAKFREQNIAHYDRLFARRGPARQTEQRAPITLIHDAVADEIVILTVIQHRYLHHACILDRAPHQLVILNAMTVVGNRYDACLRKRSDRRQLFAREIL